MMRIRRLTGVIYILWGGVVAPACPLMTSTLLSREHAAAYLKKKNSLPVNSLWDFILSAFFFYDTVICCSKCERLSSSQLDHLVPGPEASLLGFFSLTWSKGFADTKSPAVIWKVDPTPQKHFCDRLERGMNRDRLDLETSCPTRSKAPTAV